jgi:predicted Zn-dependent peptidase
LKSLEGISDRLAWFQRLGSWKGMLEYPGKIGAVKADQIPGMVKKYFKSETKVIGLLLPQSVQKSPQGNRMSIQSRKGR